LIALPFRRALARPDTGRSPWWAPPQRLDSRSSTVLGALTAAAVVFGYLNSLFGQTVAFAAEEFRAANTAQGVAGGIVRFGGIISLLIVAAADRRGRRAVLLVATVAGCLLAATGALAPSLAVLTGSQLLARACATALLILIAIIAAEEVPARCRAFAVSVLAMAGGLGAGGCVLALRLADLGPRAWRILYVLPLLALPLVRGLARRLPESRRFLAEHPETSLSGHGKRLLLLAVSGFLLNVFVAPDSQFANRFLRHERGYSGGRISLLSLSVGTPAGIGVVVGGRLADVVGRRRVAAVALTLGTAFTVLFYFANGWAMWLWALVGSGVSDAAIPALGVYGPELFPTSLRGRANGVIAVAALAGSALGLLGAGLLADHFGRIGPAMAILAIGPLAVAVLVMIAYPETAGVELEDLNPEDLGTDSESRS